MISETRLDETFPEGQFLTDGFIDRNTNGGGIALYILKDIPSRQISFNDNDKDIKHFFVEKKGKGLDGLSSKYNNYF